MSGNLRCIICGIYDYCNTCFNRNICKDHRNICSACYKGATDVISLMNKVESDKATDKSKPQSTLANVSAWVNNLKDAADEKINFHSGFASLFKEQILSDIQLKPGKGGPCIPAHAAILAAMSEIFKSMLNSEVCKAPPNDTLIVPQLDHEELEILLEFLYTGNLPQEKVEKHVFCLTIAADKYEIPYLLKVCERHIVKSLDSSNALNVLDLSQVCSNLTLKDAALSFIVKNRDHMVFSEEFEVFASKNPNLVVQITRAMCKK